MSKSSRLRTLIFINVKKVPRLCFFCPLYLAEKQPFVMSQWVLKPYLYLHRVSDSIPCQLFCPAFRKTKQLLANRAAVSAGSQNPSFFPDAENKGLSMLFSGDIQIFFVFKVQKGWSSGGQGEKCSSGNGCNIRPFKHFYSYWNTLSTPALHMLETTFF